ncbi:MAG: esterase/lipase/thioesterase family lipase, partial [Rhodoferax sp.]|nr:esterase/lipase/thioesterase family lipase [Rhodoferax sp.]
AGATMDGLVQAGYEPASNPAASPIYDVAVLLNPAFEATRFEPLFQAAKRREKNPKRIPWPEGQHPLLVSITSEGDWATKIAFPLGRTVNSLFQKETWIDQDEAENLPEWSSERVEKQGNTHTVGHLPRYRTHTLTLSGSGATAQAQCAPVDNKFVEHTNNFPLWNMFASRDVSADHGDIYGRPLWEFIARVAAATDGTQPICLATPLPVSASVTP